MSDFVLMTLQCVEKEMFTHDYGMQVQQQLEEIMSSSKYSLHANARFMQYTVLDENPWKSYHLKAPAKIQNAEAPCQ